MTDDKNEEPKSGDGTKTDEQRPTPEDINQVIRETADKSDGRITELNSSGKGDTPKDDDKK